MGEVIEWVVANNRVIDCMRENSIFGLVFLISRLLLSFYLWLILTHLLPYTWNQSYEYASFGVGVREYILDRIEKHSYVTCTINAHDFYVKK